ncbi:MAG: SDR family oxidoreductase [Sphingobacteriales bacterium]|nr:SDR family oxidoreductase [Sphingobacteriales bacterium]MCC7222866.1 SDR family oxidoreductase [Chitinophagales bacterium]
MLYTQAMLPDGTFSGKTVLITGGGTGLGKSMTRYFLQLGANVVIASRKIDVLKATADELSAETGGRVLPLQCDVRDYEQVENVLRQAFAEFGSIDVLINNAAGNFISPTERLSPRAFSAVIDIVLKGTIHFTLALGKHWIAQQQRGTILSIVTTYAWTGSAYVVPSACAKAGVLAMMRSLAVEWARYDIRCNAIAPGPFPTEGAWSRLMPDPIREKFEPANKIPVGRVGEHQELANLVAYLASDYAAFINGDCITIDGGEWLKGAGEFNNLDMVTPEMWDMLEMFTKGAK